MERWSGRVDTASDFDIPTSSSNVDPCPGNSLLSSGRFCTPSFNSAANVFVQIVQEKAEDSAWVELFATDSERTVCVELMTSDKNNAGKGQQLPSDEISARKRKARNITFKTLGLYCLRSMHAALFKSSFMQKSFTFRRRKRGCLPSFQVVQGTLVAGENQM